MTTEDEKILPGWSLNVDEFSPGGYRITLTDDFGRTAEVVDVFNDSTLQKCASYAFDIERQVNKNWNKFLYDFSVLELKKVNLEKVDYQEEVFGSWVIQTNGKRLVLDGKDGWIFYEETQDSDWIAEGVNKDSANISLSMLLDFLMRMR